jgi:glycerophosphoryl diester phosphodiesterase
MLCIGHRGASGVEPENTLRSIRVALDAGADGIEVDVQLVDGQLVVFHDRRLERTTNGRGLLSRKRFDYLRSLDAGCGERIPTLAEVCAAAAGRGAFINIELKGPRTAEAVNELIESCVTTRGWRREDFLVSSFRRDELRRLAGAGLRLGILLKGMPVRLPCAVGCWAHIPSTRRGMRWARTSCGASTGAACGFSFTPSTTQRISCACASWAWTAFSPTTPPGWWRCGLTAGMLRAGGEASRRSCLQPLASGSSALWPQIQTDWKKWTAEGFSSQRSPCALWLNFSLKFNQRFPTIRVRAAGPFRR